MLDRYNRGWLLTQEEVRFDRTGKVRFGHTGTESSLITQEERRVNATRKFLFVVVLSSFPTAVLPLIVMCGAYFVFFLFFFFLLLDCLFTLWAIISCVA